MMREVRKKHRIQYYLDSNHELNNLKFDFIRWEALHLKYTNDTNSVVVIHLGEGLTYREFAKLLDMMVIDDHGRYFEWKNVFYILGKEPPGPKRDEIKSIYL
jgi:hypothetical protein